MAEAALCAGHLERGYRPLPLYMVLDEEQSSWFDLLCKRIQEETIRTHCYHEQAYEWKQGVCLYVEHAEHYQGVSL